MLLFALEREKRLVAALMLSLAGFVKALFGEDWRMPFLGDYRDRVPGLNWQEG
ncbi:MAG TPA: hypothetical protein VII85_02120 [Candidatus Krumholzibacteriaceae bacterium]